MRQIISTIALLVVAALQSSIAHSAPPSSATATAHAPKIAVVDEARVAELLGQARKARELGHLVQPAEINALELYLQVLALQPDNKEAQRAVAQLRVEAQHAAAHIKARGESPEEQRLQMLIRRAGSAVVGPLKASPGPDMHPSLPLQLPQPETPTKAVTAVAAKPLSPNAVDQILQALPWGQLAFNAPSQMQWRHADIIHAVLSGTASADDLKKKITEPGLVEAHTIQIADEMEAHLSGTGFDIEAVNPERQAVGHTHATEWIWNVTPKARGAQHLELTVNARVKIDGDDSEVSIMTYERDIEVDISWSDAVEEFIADNWQWLWATILPVAGYVWHRLAARKKQQRKKKR